MLVHDEWLYTAAGLERLRRALPSQKGKLWLDPQTNALQLEYIDDDEQEELFHSMMEEDMPS